jgi:hypothetical protein
MKISKITISVLILGLVVFAMGDFVMYKKLKKMSSVVSLLNQTVQQQITQLKKISK